MVAKIQINPLISVTAPLKTVNRQHFFPTVPNASRLDRDCPQRLQKKGGRITASLLQPTYERITKNTLTFELWKLLFLRRYGFCFFMLSKRYCRGVTPINL
jgi:hypothetical protein